MIPSHIEELQNKVDLAKNTYLRARGWTHNCDVPGSYWLWQKVLPDGRTCLLERDMAISIQAVLDTR